MMSPIGQYLTEFRPTARPSFAPPPVEEMPADFVAAMDFDPDESAFLALTDESDGLALPDGEEAAADEPDAGAEAPSGLAFEAALDALKAEHAAELASARQQWAESEGAVLAGRIAQCFDDLEKKLGDTLAPMLEPFLAKAAQLKVLDQLRDTIGTLLAGGDQRPVTVSGPEDLIEAIKRAYPGPSALVFQTADEPDVTITMGDTRIRSQLRSWARKLDAALGSHR